MARDAGVLHGSRFQVLEPEFLAEGTATTILQPDRVLVGGRRSGAAAVDCLANVYRRGPDGARPDDKPVVGRALEAHGERLPRAGDSRPQTPAAPARRLSLHAPSAGPAFSVSPLLRSASRLSTRSRRSARRPARTSPRWRTRSASTRASALNSCARRSGLAARAFKRTSSTSCISAARSASRRSPSTGTR